MENSTLFDPFAQSFTLLTTDGTPFNVSIPQLNDFIYYNVKICINYAAQLGASLILLVVIVLLTKTDRRKSPMYIFNVLALTLNVIRMATSAVFFTGNWVEVYSVFARDYSKVTQGDYATSVASTIIDVILYACIEISLIIQMRVVCVTLRSIYRDALTILMVLIALVAFGFRLALCIANIRAILTTAYELDLARLSSAANISFTLAICCVCVVFIAKLGFALYQRRKLGVDQFGPMRIIFIMGCQTLFIPAIFSILQYCTNLPAMSSNVLTLVTIFLPLSSLWASTNLVPKEGRGVQRHNRFFGRPDSNSTSQGPILAGLNSNETLSPTYTTNTRFGSHIPPSPSRTDTMYGDLEAQGMHGLDHFFGAGTA